MIEKIVQWVNAIVWSPALLVVLIFAAVLFSLSTRFLQVRRIGLMIKLLFFQKVSHGSVSSFQAFCLSLSGRVGTGNIVGVAMAIAYGGPGAIFWMWIIAFLGASSAFVESTLSQIYKVRYDSEYRGGPSYFIHKALHCKWLAVVFAVVTIFTTGFLLPLLQSNSVASAFVSSYNISPNITGCFIAFLLGLVVIGGVKRIASVAKFVTPFMTIGYIIISLIIIFFNIDKIPSIFAMIFSNAFGINPICGGIFGSSIMWGIKRGVFSNEAGQGSGPIISASAKVNHPAEQGYVQAFSVYVDTLFVCTATALMILVSGTYNILDAKTGEILVANAPQLADNYNTYTQTAVDMVFPDFGNQFVSIALFFFAFTSLMAYYYYAETSVIYVSTLKGKTHNKRNKTILIWILRCITMTAICFGSGRKAFVAWQLGDIGVGMMAWINVISIIILCPIAIKTLKDYERQKKLGIKQPVFNPQKLGIKDTDVWNI